MQTSRPAIRCQRAIIAATHKLFARQLGVAHRCVDSLLACRLAAGGTGPLRRDRRALSAQVRRVGRHQRRAPRPSGRRGRARVCRRRPRRALRADGLGFAGIAATRALGLGAPPPTRRGSRALPRRRVRLRRRRRSSRRALPAIDGELARFGLALGDDFACPHATASPTPTVTPGPNGTPTATPTTSATPDRGTDRHPVTLLVPGGGSAPPTASPNGRCGAPPSIRLRPHASTVSMATRPATATAPPTALRFGLGLCLAGTDPQLARLPRSPAASCRSRCRARAGASNPIERENARRSRRGERSGGRRARRQRPQRLHVRPPPHVLTPPQHCTLPRPSPVDRRGLERRTERFRARAIARHGAEPCATTATRSCSAASPRARSPRAD